MVRGSMTLDENTHKKTFKKNDESASEQTQVRCDPSSESQVRKDDKEKVQSFLYRATQR